MKYLTKDHFWAVAIGLVAVFFLPTLSEAQDALPEAVELPLYWVDINAVYKAHPKAETFEASMKAMVDAGKAELAAAEKKWQEANAASDAAESARLQAEYKALLQKRQAELQKKRQELNASIAQDIQAGVDEIMSNLLAYVLVNDFKQGKYKEGHYFMIGGEELGDLTLALDGAINEDPDSSILFSITTPCLGHCYKVNFDALVKDHPQHADRLSELAAARQKEKDKLDPDLQAVKQAQLEVERLSKEGVTGAKLEEVMIETRALESRMKRLGAQADVRMEQLKAALKEPMVKDIEAAIIRLLPPGKNYLIVSDLPRPGILPAYYAPELGAPPDITAHVSARLKQGR